MVKLRKSICYFYFHQKKLFNPRWWIQLPWYPASTYFCISDCNISINVIREAADSTLGFMEICGSHDNGGTQCTQV